MDNRFLSPHAAPRLNSQPRAGSRQMHDAGAAFGDLFSRVTESFGADQISPAQGFGGAPRVRQGGVSSPISSASGRLGSGFGSYMPASTYNRNEFSQLAHRMNMERGGLGSIGQVGQQLGAGSGSSVGTAGNTGTMADDANAELSAASARHGVPVNFLKAKLLRESSGNWSRDGSRHSNIRPSMGPLLPYVGIFQATWDSWGCPGNVHSALGNKAAQIDCMAKGARMLYDKAKSVNPAYDWRNVASMYFSGKWEPSRWTDELGMSSEKYVGYLMNDWQKFDAMSGGAGYTTPAQGFGGSGGGGAIASIWGGSGERDLSYGFNAPNNLGLYAYGSQYGMDGRGHTGIDIPGQLNEPARTPVGGTVVCGSTGNGPGAGGSGCSAFNDVMGSGAGRIEVQLDNGHTMIFGHMSQSHVRPGQRVNAGDVIGTFGGMNGVHVHLEYRIPDSSTPSGWRIVDPSQYLNGAASFGSQTGTQPSQMSYNPNVPFQGWQGRTLGQNRAARSPYVSTMMGRYR